MERCGSKMQAVRTVVSFGSCLLVLGCATGKTPPAPTEMVRIDDRAGLTFTFGTTGICDGNIEVSEEEYCADHSSNSITISINKGEPLPSAPTMLVTIAPFEIDAHEVTNLQYLHCVELGDCSEPKFGNAGNIQKYYNRSDGKFDHHPVVNVTWEQAKAYCLSKGKRLPTEYEWELVATEGSTKYAPWGDNLDACNNKKIAIKGCNIDHVTDPVYGPQKVGDSSDDVVQVGGESVFDMGGNVSEWVEDVHDRFQTCKDEVEGDGCAPEAMNCYAICNNDVPVDICIAYDEEDQPLSQPTSKLGSGPRGVRGGSFAHVVAVSTTQEVALCAARPRDRSQSLAQDATKTFVGFRCARSL
jgi:formylglycine-generating enzyme required for sulfatase activity